MHRALLSLGLVVSISAGAAEPSPCQAAEIATLELGLRPRAVGLSPAVLHLALAAYQRAVCEKRATRARLAVIDYSVPSRDRRLWVFDLASSKLLFLERVAHGRGSGEDPPSRFSNDPGSLASSLGAFVTGGTYLGKHGLSLTLDGLDVGVNDLARSRAVVIHGAWYVSDTFARAHGRLGRSWGCPAVSEEVAPTLIESLRDGAVVFAWYPAHA